MSKKSGHKDSTTDFFLKFITRQKENTEKGEEKHKDTNENIEVEENSSRDKAVITLLKGVNNLNILLDKMLFSKISIKILSFVMTVLLVFVINGGSLESILSSPTGGERLNGVPILIEGLGSQFEVSGISETVDVMLIGPTFDIYTTRVSNDYEVYIDLTNFVEGEYEVEYKYRNFSPRLDVFIAPERVTIKISPKVTETFTLGYQFINEESLDEEQSVAVTKMEHQEVEIRGSQDIIDTIFSVDAIIDLQKTARVDGVFEQEAEIFAFDRSGEEVAVEIIPKTVTVECQISSYSQEVALVPNIVGYLQEGFSVAKIELEETKVRIYGDEDRIKNIESIPVNIDVSGYSDSQIRRNVAIDKMEGINKVSKSEILVIVDISNTSTKVLDNIPITVLNNNQDFNVVFNMGEDIASIDVTGATAILENIDAGDFTVTIDLDGLEEGQNLVYVNILATNYLLDYELISKDRLIITLGR